MYMFLCIYIYICMYYMFMYIYIYNIDILTYNIIHAYNNSKYNDVKNNLTI